MLSTCASEAPVDRRQAAKLLLLRQQFRLERVQSCGERRPTLPNLVVADQPKLRILRESLGVVRILRSASDGRSTGAKGQQEAAVYPFPRESVRCCSLNSLNPTRFIQLPYRNQTTIRT